MAVGNDRIASVRESQEEGSYCEHDEVFEDRRRRSYKFP